MGNRVTVTFVGVCAIVPDKPFFEKIGGKWRAGRKAPKKVSVLLPNLAEPNLSSWSQLASQEAPSVIQRNHTPVMAFRLNDLLVQESLEPDIIIRDPATGEQIGIIVLSEKHVRLGSKATPRELSCDLRVSKKEKPSSGEERSLWWLPRMAEISPKHDVVSNKLDPTQYPSLKNSGVLATFQFKSGSLYIDDFSRSISGNEESPWKFSKIEWVKKDGRFRPTGNTYWSRSLGNKVSVDLPFSEDSFAFHIREKKSDDPQKLLLRPSKLLRRAHLWIANLEPDTLTSILVQSSTKQPSSVGDPDFEAFYRMVGAEVKDFGPVPFRESHEAGDYLRPCAPTSFSRFK